MSFSKKIRRKDQQKEKKMYQTWCSYNIDTISNLYETFDIKNILQISLQEFSTLSYHCTDDYHIKCDINQCMRTPINHKL